MNNHPSYEIFFYLKVTSNEHLDLSLIERNHFKVNYEPIGTVSKYSGKKSMISYLKITTERQGEEYLESLYEFINSIELLEKFFDYFPSQERVLYVSQNYWYQCNFELDYNKLNVLSKYKISLAVSSQYCDV
jgi:hypothetical protein